MNNKKLKDIKVKAERLGEWESLDLDTKSISEDMTWLVETIENQQAEIDSLSMAHDDMHRLIDRDKHFLIKSNINLNRKVQELELSNILQVDEITHLDELLDGLKHKNKRYRDLLEKVDYLLEKAGETDEDIYDLVRHVRTLIYLEEGEE